MSGRAEANQEAAEVSRRWPRQMRADTAAAYCDEPSVEAFLAKIPATYPAGYDLRPGEPRWLIEDITEALMDERERLSKTCWVYFVRATSSGLVKIGMANNVARRLRELQGASPEKLELLTSIEGDRGVELAFHKALATYRSHKEWFRPGDWLEPTLSDILANEPAEKILEKLWGLR